MKLFSLIILTLFMSTLYGQTNQNIEYFRHLRYNHVSPYINFSGIHPISEATAKSTSHYVFKFDSNNKLTEIVNIHYHTEKRHPLASIGVYKLLIEYKDGKEIRSFYDPNGRRVSNDRAVYKEVFFLDKNQFKYKLQFYDLNDKPMESNWAISEYKWKQENDLIIERRYNLKGKQVNVSPYFEFGTTGILLDQNEFPKAHYNLDEQLAVVNSPSGVASYQDSFDIQGNHILYRYYDSNNILTLNQWKFASGKKSYDSLGNNIHLEQFGIDGESIRSRPIYSNSVIAISPSASAIDSNEVKKQSLGYLKALQQLDTLLMNRVMNDSLNKVTIGYNRNIKKEIAKATTRNQMIAFAENWNKSNTKFPPNPNNQVTILGIYDRIASVKLVSDNWVEYLHLIKLDGEWTIVNLIWQHKDVNRYPN